MHEVVYFDAPGRAEVLRVLLHAANIEFKDTRFPGKDWPKIKPTTPLGSVPVLKIDDKQYCQSVALQRYAAKLAGFYPEDPMEALIVDEAMDTMNELLSKAPQADSDEEKKLKRAQFQAGAMTTYSKFLESRIQESGGCGFVSSPSMADLALMGTVSSVQEGFWDHIDANFFDAYPGIVATCESIKQNPKLVAYYDSLEEKEE